MATYEDVLAFLNANPGEHTYSEVAAALGYAPKQGDQAVGSMMRAIHDRGLHDYCVRVVDSKTRQHGCDHAVADDGD